MTIPNGIPAKEAPDGARPIDSQELIERLAEEMRVKSGGELPLAFCLEQVRRRLADKPATIEIGKTRPETDARRAAGVGRSTFDTWALSE